MLILFTGLIGLLSLSTLCWLFYFWSVRHFKNPVYIKMCFTVMTLIWVIGGSALILRWQGALYLHTTFLPSTRAVAFLAGVFLAWLSPPWLIIVVMRCFYPSQWHEIADKIRGSRTAGAAGSPTSTPGPRA